MGGVDVTVDDVLVNPILNSPYEEPSRHLKVGPKGPTGEIVPGRRPSQSFIPIAPSTKKDPQLELDFDITGERIEENPLINAIRDKVKVWRLQNYPGVTPVSRKLLQYWTSLERENRILFCQREAAETAIFLAEGRDRQNFVHQIAELNAEYNDALPRVALKMATGTGKTVVLGMLIAWQTINKVRAPGSKQFTKKFLIIAPGLTIRDRLQVLKPSRDDNYYKQRDLVPVDLWGDLLQAEIAITNYHAFLPRATREGEGLAANVKKVLLKPGQPDPFVETQSQVVTRVLKDLSNNSDPIIVLNDEAHHCYVDKPLASEKLGREDQARNEDARVWFKGIAWIAKHRNVRAVYDLSATPYFLKGSGHQEGFIFPWTVSDFSLIEAIESGIVKIPRLPVDDDSTLDEKAVYRNLWAHVGDKLPKRQAASIDPSTWVIPAVLEGAIRSLYRSYSKAYNYWDENLRSFGEPPPVMILVCPNTTVSRLMFDWVAGHFTDSEKLFYSPGNLELLSNSDEHGLPLSRPHTILVDSAQLESGEALTKDFREAAGLEIEKFRDDYRRRFPGADVDKLTDADLLREVMNTVGKKGQLGEHVRCVVSVSMLTEGWDANNVSHILGIRAFGSQLLCEQVVGRGLRRRNYEVNEDGLFEPEYAEVYGVPFSVIPGDTVVVAPKPKAPSTSVFAIPERYSLTIEFPKLDGYRLEIPAKQLHWAFSDDTKMTLDGAAIVDITYSEDLFGYGEEIASGFDEVREQRVVYLMARRMLIRKFGSNSDKGDAMPWLFPQLVTLCREWVRSELKFQNGAVVGHLSIEEQLERAIDRAFHAVVQQDSEGEQILLPIIRRFDPEGSTEDVDFTTRKPTIEATKSHVNMVVLDGIKGNTWEEAMARTLEKHSDVRAYVKNDHLGFEIPYVTTGVPRMYVPDFLVRLHDIGDGVSRTLIVEVSGSHKPKEPTRDKADTARLRWCRAVNNDGRWGRWGYIEVGDPNANDYDDLIGSAIDLLLNDDRGLTGIED